MLLTARAILLRRHETRKRPSWRRPKIESIRRATPLPLGRENEKIMRIRETKAKKDKVLDRSEEQFLFGIRDRLNARAKRLERQLKSGRLNGQRKLVEKELIFVNGVNEKLISIIAATNQRMVRNFAIRFGCACPSSGMDLEDLIQEGNIGLLRAIEKFDVNRNRKLYTYAERWVRHKIRSAIAKNGNPVKVPRDVSYAEMRVKGFISKYNTKWNMDPTADEVAEATKLRVELVRKVLNLIANKKLFEMNEDRDSPNNETPFDFIAAKEAEELIKKLVTNLKKEKHREIIRRRFGLDGEEEATLKDIGNDLKVKRETVRLIQNRALSKLLRSARRAGLDGC